LTLLLIIDTLEDSSIKEDENIKDFIGKLRELQPNEC
jgi:hypothetical protein